MLDLALSIEAKASFPKGGPTYGPEKVTNGSFATDTDWTKTAGWTISGGKANSNNAGGTFNPLYEYVGTLTGHLYHLIITISDYTSGTLIGNLADGNATPSMTAAGTYGFDITATGDYLLLYGWNGFVGSLSFVSLKEVL